jgi:meso-butanediol dehydrogenase/(S,S)-butanediol dehydrogenase/diacetyl reductase
MGRVDGKVALISGTARGQGRAATLRFDAEGAVVSGGDPLDDEHPLDVTDEASVAAWVDRTLGAGRGESRRVRS